jgi:excisionase family DNA binding protein
MPATTVIQDDALLTVSEVAKTLRVDDTTTRRWIKNGVLTAVTLPHHGRRQSYRIRQSELNKILEGTTK